MDDLISRQDAEGRVSRMDDNIGFADGFAAGYKLGKEYYKPQWIPVSERLPEKSGLYLTWAKFPYEEEPSWLIINYDADCESFGEWEEHYHPDTLGYLDSEFNEFENVFAWMPLPEPYRGRR